MGGRSLGRVQSRLPCAPLGRCVKRAGHTGPRQPFPADGTMVPQQAKMRLLFRLLGTWLLGIALILLIIDGTRSLAASGLVMTSLSDTWRQLHEASLLEVQSFLSSRFFGPVLQPVVSGLVGLPAWLVFAVPGGLLAWMGRTRRARVFVKQDQF
jgi:hypothetical protein